MSQMVQKVNQSVQKNIVDNNEKPFSRKFTKIKEPMLRIMSNQGALRRELVSFHPNLVIDSHIPYKTEMEEVFSRDFSNVKAYSGQEARTYTEVVGVEAFTVGDKIFFANSHPTKDMVAHELTHIVQHDRKINDRTRAITSPNEPAEREARRVQNAFAEGRGAPEIYEALPPSVLSPNWSSPICLTIEGIRGVEAQYDSESEQLRLVFSLPPWLFGYQEGIRPPNITGSVQEAIGLEFPDSLRNMQWLEIERGGGTIRYEILYDVDVLSVEGRELLDRFFPTAPPSAEEIQQISELAERERQARQAENEPEFLTSEEIEEYAQGELPIEELVATEEQRIIAHGPQPAVLSIRNDLWGYGVDMLGTWRLEVRDAVRGFQTEGTTDEKQINWLIALGGSLIWACTVFAATGPGVAAGVAAMSLGGATLGAGGVRLSRASSIQDMFGRLCENAIDPLKQHIEQSNLPHLVDLLAVRAVRTNVSNPQELSCLIWSHMFPAIQYDNRESAVRQRVTRNLQTLWPIFEDHYDLWYDAMYRCGDETYSGYLRCREQHPFTANMAFGGVSLESLLLGE